MSPPSPPPPPTYTQKSPALLRLKSWKQDHNFKNDFYKIQIHEIKTFINNINLYLNIQRKNGKKYDKDRLEKCKNDVKKTWNVMNELIKTSKSTKGNIRTRMIIDGYETIDQE